MSRVMECDYSALSTSITRTEIGSCNFSGCDDLTDETDQSTETMETKLFDYGPNILDRFNLVFLTFILLGLGTLLPWNFFITANDYWMYKFRNTSMDKDYDPHHNKTDLQVAFTSYLAIANNGPLIIMLIVSSVIGHRTSPKLRLVASLSVMLVLFVLVTGFVKIHTDEIQMKFFAFTMTSVILISASGAVFQAGVTGVASVLPSKYMKAMMSGQAIAGIFAAVTHIFSLLGHVIPTTSALAYFICADVTLLVMLFSYIFISKTDFLKYYLQLSEESKNNKLSPSHLYASSSIVQEEMYTESSNSVNVPVKDEEGFLPSMKYEANINGMEVPDEHSHKLPILVIFRQVWPQAISVLLTFWVTLSVFPAVMVLVSSENQASGSLWTGRLFIPINCFLLFNVGDLCGRIVGGSIPVPSSRSHLLLTFSCCRVIFIPLFMLCNTHPRSNIPVVFLNDAYFISFSSLLGLTNGYVATVGMTQAARLVNKSLQEQTGNIMAAFMGGGLIFGSVTSYGFVKLLTKGT